MNTVLATILLTISFSTISLAGELYCECTDSKTVEYVKGEKVIFGDEMTTITTTFGTFRCVDINANPMLAMMLGQLDNANLVNLIMCENQLDITKGPGMLLLSNDNKISYSVGDVDNVATFKCEEID